MTRTRTSVHHNPISGKLITDKETIKKVSIEHCAKILSKNEIRDGDGKELREKERTHKTKMDDNEKEKLQYKIIS